MIKYGYGVTSIPKEKIKESYKLLITFYETKNMEKIKEFIYNNCIDGCKLLKKQFV